MVMANLPYIPTAVIDTLAPEVREWEPRGALDGGADGLDVMRALVRELPEHFAEGAHAVLLEVGFGQGLGGGEAARRCGGRPGASASRPGGDRAGG